MIERTLVLIKPEGMARALTGKVLSTFEDAGLKIVAIKTVRPDSKLAERHYPYTKEWAENVWSNTKKASEEHGNRFDETAEQTGRRVQGYLMNAITGKPIIAIVLEGNEAVFVARKLLGATEPRKADPSSIRGRYSFDSYDMADSAKRIINNVAHASGDKDTAAKEIAIWFRKDEILEYERCDEHVMFS